MAISHRETVAAQSDPRIALAAERTLLAWIRTGLALMGFGFVVARFGLFLCELVAATGEHMRATPGFSLWIGAGLILLGVVVNVLAAIQHVRFLGKLRRGEAFEPAVWSAGVFVTVFLAVMGLVMTVYLVMTGT